MSDFFESIKAREKKEREELAKQAIQELLKLNWLKIRTNRGHKIFEEEIRDAVDEFIYDILSYEKEMKQCPKLEELIVNITRKQIEWSLPYGYQDIVAQSSHNEYIIAATSVEDLVNELNKFLEPVLDDIDYDELSKTYYKKLEVKE